MTSWNVYALIFPSGRKYIGVAKNPTQRFARHYRDSKNGSDLVVHKAIRKYGIENVNLNILFTELTAKQAKRKEIQTIIECGTQVPKGYNMTAGGDGVVSPCLATKQKMSKSQILSYRDPFLREKRSKIQKLRFKKASERNRISRKVKAFYSNPDNRKRLSISLKIKWKSPQYAKKTRLALQNRIISKADREERSKNAKIRCSNPAFKKRQSRLTKLAWKNGKYGRLPQVKKKFKKKFSKKELDLKKEQANRKRSVAVALSWDSKRRADFAHKMRERWKDPKYATKQRRIQRLLAQKRNNPISKKLISDGLKKWWSKRKQKATQ